jgi:hypothetical protein
VSAPAAFSPVQAAAPAQTATGIPIAVPIPFTHADSPTAGMLERLRSAKGQAVAGIDPRAVEALLALSREVIERVVWEVVPELAEQIIQERRA